MSEKELLNVLLGKAYQIAPERIAELLYKKSDDDAQTPTDELLENAPDILLKIDAERIAKVKPGTVDTKALYDKAAQEEAGRTHAKWEKMVREKFGVDAANTLKGEELLAAVKAATAKAAEQQPLTADIIKISPEYMALEASKKNALEEKDAEFQAKLTELQTTFERQQQWSDVSKTIRQTFKGLNPVLPKDAAKAEAQVDLFVSQNFAGYDFKRTEDGRMLVMKDGARVDNAHGHPVFLEDLVQAKADALFDFEKQPAVGQAGNTNGDTRPGVKIKFEADDKGSIDADFFKRYGEAKTEADREAISAAYELQAQG